MLVDKITKSLDAGDIVISVFFYLKKAFDTVYHHVQFKKCICLWHLWKSVGIGFIVIYLIDPNMSIYDDMQSENTSYHI